jgi:hypothetical protein
MDLELATIDDIVNELADRGLQFVIAVQLRVEGEDIERGTRFKVHLCVDGNKNKVEVANALIPFFNPKGNDECSPQY